jgi:pectate lyase
MRVVWLSVLMITGLAGPCMRPAETEGCSWATYAKKPDAWYSSPEGARVADNVLSHQSLQGSWPKNIDTSSKPYEGDRARLHGTFDNGATRSEIRFLTRAYNATKREPYRSAVLKALDHILQAQYPTGGWPQYHPPGSGYNRHITFNDGAMVGLMNLLREVARSDEFAFVDPARRRKAKRAFDRGVECILRCQIGVDGRPTAWCAQHDEKTLEPRKGRSYEHVSISGGESAGVVCLLMSLEDPSPEVIRAVNAACQWYEAAKLTGIRQIRRDGDRVIVPDPDAPPLWARFYEIGTNRPIFSGRDGVIKYHLSQIEHERRNGYSWYGYPWYGGSGTEVLAQWARWKKKHGL